ncbi:MAG: DUF1292 domain-containing protein [Mycoplasmatales bacterium]
MDNEEKYITLIDDDDNEVLAEILFTFKNDGENYVLLTPVKELEDKELEDEYDVIAYKYEEMEDQSVGNLIEIREDAQGEWEMIEEMLETFAQTNFELEDDEDQD